MILPPRLIMAGAGALALVATVLLWLFFHDRRVIDEHEASTKARVEALSSEAAARAAETAEQSRNEVEQANDEARNAAARGHDPLRDGLDSLRAGKGAPSAAAR